MSLFNYQKYKIAIDPKSKKTQGLSAGDIVRRQYFDFPNVIYSLMLVLDTGVDIIIGTDGKEQRSQYFIGALLDGDEPKNEEVLDFVRMTNLFNADRSGALYLTSSDSESPYMDVVDGMSTENSLCYPYMGDGLPDVGDIRKYAAAGAKYITTSYSKSSLDSYRVFRVTRNGLANASNETIGFKQTLEKQVKNPQRLIISYKIRSSKALKNVPLSFGYTTGGSMDGQTTVNTTADWQYQVSIITVDFPAQYSRSLLIDLTKHLTNQGDWCEISDLNISLLSDVGNFGKSTKARVGKITGIIDPLFGTIQGYGAYFQNMYATKNVNISGTLTAGDENGFASTFYVGRIRKNSFLNSLNGSFTTSNHTILSTNDSPTGIGKVFKIGSGVTVMKAQLKDWLNKHIGEKYCFSLWAKSSVAATLAISHNGESVENVPINIIGDWTKIYIQLVLKNTNNTDLLVTINASIADILISSPQLESGVTPTLYQPTDGTLVDSDEYGAWFSRGGIGGTIQNPLLKLNNDGSIASTNGSFVINPDGTGYFSNGAIRWGKDSVTLGENVILKWDNLSPETQQNLTGKDGKDGVNGKDGLIGANGVNGQTTYTWIKYSDNADGTNLYDQPTANTKYIGVATNKINPTESTSKADYIWSLIKGADGANGKDGANGANGKNGVDANLLDWVSEWNGTKTTINSNTVLTPKIYTGTKNANGTITGVALGAFQLITQSSTGVVSAENVNGIYGFNAGRKTFAIDSTGNVEIGRDNDSIKYNATTGKIDFGSNVVLNWVNYTDNEVAVVKKQAEGSSYQGGKILYRDIDFRNGLNGIAVYNNSNNGNVVVSRISRQSDCPTTSTHCIQISNKGTASPALGGFTFATQTRANAKFITRIVAKIPIGYSIAYGSNAIGAGGSSKWASSLIGTGKYEEYVCIVQSGTTGSFSSTNFYYLNGVSGSTDTPIIWYLASATVYDMTQVEVDYVDYTDTAKQAALTAANNAQNTANTSKITADSASSRLNDWANDSIISPTEKTGLKQQLADIQSEFKDIQSQVNKYLLSTSTEWVNYNSAYNLAVTAFNKYTATSPENIAIVSDYSNIAAYYGKRQLVLDKVVSSAKLYAETLVDNIEVGGTNLLLSTQFFNNSWSNVNSAVLTNEYYKGFRIVKHPDAWRYFSQPLAFDASSIYTLSAYVKAETPNTMLYVSASGITSGYVTQNIALEWTRYSWTFTAPQSLTSAIAFLIPGTASNKLIYICGYKLEKGNKATDWSPSPEDVQLAIDKAQLDADTANGKISDITNDNILDVSEKQDILKEWQIIQGEYAIAVSQGTTYGVSSSDYTTKYNSLSSYITPLLANMTVNSTIVGATFRVTFKVYYDAKIALLKSITDKAKSLADTAQSSANNAQTAANNAKTTADNAQSSANAAQSSANTANNLLSNIADDNLLMPSEKQDVLKEWGVVQGEYPTIIAQSTTYGASSTTYTNTYNSLKTYITPLLSNMTINSSIVGSTFRSTFKAYYDAKVALLKVVTDYAKSLADAAQLSANSAQSTANSSVNALGGASFPKLTQITSTGVYTGTLTATQVNAVGINASSISTGTLSADRIAANSINANKIIAGSITADRILAGSITAAQLNIANLQANLITTSFIEGLSFNFVKGTVGGWTISSGRIAKNNVFFSEDGTIGNVNKWALRNDGSGFLASNSITWDTAGNLTFADSVKLNWTNYTDSKVDNIQIGGVNFVLNSKEIAQVASTNNFTFKSLSLSENLSPNTQYTLSIGKTEITSGTAVTSFTVLAYNHSTSSGSTNISFPISSDRKTVTFTTGNLPNNGYTLLMYAGASGASANRAMKWTEVQLEKGNKATDWTPAIEDTQASIYLSYNTATRKVRYIRDWANGSTSNTGNHWVQIRANDNNGVNQALDKKIVGTMTGGSNVLNGNTDSGNYAYYVPNIGLQSVLVDLGNVHEIDNIQVWHYYTDSRTYYNTKTEVSVDGVNWFSVFDSAIEGVYQETSNGRRYYIKEYENSSVKSQLAQTTADNAQTTANNAQISATTANNLLADIANDNKFDPSEKQSALKEWSIIQSEYTKNIAQAATFGVASGSYSTTYNALNAYITPLLSNLGATSDIVGGTFRTTFKAHYDTRTDLLNLIASKARDLANSAQSSANTAITNASTAQATANTAFSNAAAAQTTANNAQTSANTANSLLSNIADDNLLMPYEKQDILKEWQIIQGEYPTVLAQASTYAVSSADYTTKYNSLNNYITPLLTNLTVNSAIVGTTFRLSFKNYYDTKITLLKTVTDKAKALADSAQISANSAQTTANSSVNALGGINFPKLTSITSTGVYTGTLTAAQVNAIGINASSITTGVLSVDRIAANSINASKIVSGSITASQIDTASVQADVVTTGYIQGLSINFSKGKIGSWVIDADSIYIGTKNNTHAGFTSASNMMTIGNYGIRGYKWRLDALGAGALAGGAIQWDSAGTITFDESVSLNWTKVAEGNSYQGGKILNRDIDFRSGNNGIYLYNNSSNGNTILSRIVRPSDCPTTSGYCYQVSNIGAASPGLGGFTFVTQTRANAKFITRIIAKIPVGYNIAFAYNSFGTGSTSKWATATAGTGKYEEYLLTAQCGSSGTFSSINFFYINGTTGTAAAPIVWYIASAAVYDMTQVEVDYIDYTDTAKQTALTAASGAQSTANSAITNAANAQTTANSSVSALGGASFPKLTSINSTGIYTGTLTASQITAGTINVARLDASAIQANIVNTSYIQGLSLDFTKGVIGGWSIGAGNISIGNIGAGGATPIQIRSSASGSGYVYTGDQRLYGITMTWHQSNNAGHFVFGQVMSGGNVVKTGFYGIQMMSWDNTEYFCLSANTSKSGSKEMYNRIAGWAFDNTTISKGNVTLGSDGTIQNAGKWRFSNDGSGAVASGNISWDAAGNTTINGNVNISGTAIGKAITTDSLSVGNNFKIDKDGTLHATNGEFSGTLSGVRGSFYTLSALDSEGIAQAEIAFDSTEGKLWFYGDIQHQGAINGRSSRFYTSDLYCRGSFGSNTLVTLVVYGTYGRIYAGGLPNGNVYVTFSSTSYGGNTVYALPLYSANGAGGIPVDLVVFSTGSTYNYQLQSITYKKVTVANGYDGNNNIFIYTNNRRIQLVGGKAAEMINIGYSMMNPVVSDSAMGAGWLFCSEYDNNWS